MMYLAFLVKMLQNCRYVWTEMRLPRIYVHIAEILNIFAHERSILTGKVELAKVIREHTCFIALDKKLPAPLNFYDRPFKSCDGSSLRQG
jgi:hypothetical protein